MYDGKQVGLELLMAIDLREFNPSRHIRLGVISNPL